MNSLSVRPNKKKRKEIEIYKAYTYIHVVRLILADLPWNKSRQVNSSLW